MAALPGEAWRHVLAAVASSGDEVRGGGGESGSRQHESARGERGKERPLDKPCLKRHKQKKKKAPLREWQEGVLSLWNRKFFRRPNLKRKHPHENTCAQAFFFRLFHKRLMKKAQAFCLFLIFFLMKKSWSKVLRKKIKKSQKDWAFFLSL